MKTLELEQMSRIEGGKTAPCTRNVSTQRAIGAVCGIGGALNWGIALSCGGYYAYCSYAG